MSFNLSRTQFLQMFAVMQSIRLIGDYTASDAAPRLAWYNSNIQTEQFAVLTSLLSETPFMPNLKSMPSGSTAPILINPFVEGGYLPHSGPGFVVIPETGEWNIKENALYGAMDAHTSMAFTNLIRKVNARAELLTIHGCSFTGINLDCNAYGIFSDRGKLGLWDETGEIAKMEISLPHVFRANKKASPMLIDIMNHFIGQSMMDADIAAGVLVDSVNIVNDIKKSNSRSPKKTLEQKLMECPTWATW